MLKSLSEENAGIVSMTVHFCTTVLRQFTALALKNWLLSIRNLRSTLLQIFIPSFFVILMAILAVIFAIQNANQEYGRTVESYPAHRIGKIPRCRLGTHAFSCFSIAFAPVGDSVVSDLVFKVAAANDIPTAEVIGFKNLAELDKFLYEAPNVTQAAYIFDDKYGTLSKNLTNSASNVTVNYAIQFNSTQSCFRRDCIPGGYDVLIPMQLSMDEYIIAKLGGMESTFLDVQRIPFPKKGSPSTDVVAGFGPTFFVAAAMFSFVIQLGLIVGEKELKLKEAMRIMGLVDVLYWVSWYLYGFVFNQLGIFFLICAGIFFQLEFFTRTEFLCYFLLFFLFGCCTIALSFAFSTLVQKARSATSLGFILFILVDIINGICVWIVFRGDAFFDTVPVIPPLRYLFAFFPPIMFSLGITDIGTALTKGEPLKWSDIDDNQEIWPFSLILKYLFFDAILWLVVGWYLDKVLAGDYGTSHPPWFFLTPSYWFGKGIFPEREGNPKLLPDDDVDVREAALLVMEGHASNPSEYALTLDHLEKTYRKLPFGLKSLKDFTAVDHVCFAVPTNQLFCLLGPNGAGKSTIIGMLTGLFPQTSGDAHVFGFSLRSKLEKIRKFTGVCPQHDILWDDLTAAEHIRLFAAFKDIPISKINLEVTERLDDVQLLDSANMLAGQYSGGMRRRLSVAISLTGNPAICFLDEPTTGMDPVARRHVWNIVERAKRGRALVLTTHSMEEADVLGDTVAIIGRGRMQAFGTPLHLKNKFGSGYVISIAVSTQRDGREIAAGGENVVVNEALAINIVTTSVLQKRCDAAIAAVVTLIPEAVLESVHNGHIEILVGREYVSQMPVLFESLEERREELCIADLALRMTTLEEVFLAVAKKTEGEKVTGSHSQISTESDLPVEHLPMISPKQKTSQNRKS
jgi:ABC-type multidrug transport system ATPase subunit